MGTHAELIQDLSLRLTDISYRLSKYGPVLKPYLRFPRQPGYLEATRRWWDFDHRIQKRLAGWLAEMASPEEIVGLGFKRWPENLAALARKRLNALETARQNQIPLETLLANLPHIERDIIARLERGSRFLYVGAGAGGDCFAYAAQGLNVVGIDTAAGPLQVAEQWNAILRLPVHFVCADVMHMALPADTFDGLLLEFYGAWPAQNQIACLQRELARVLKPDGIAWIKATRREYSTYWFLMGSQLHPRVTAWVKPQAYLDYRYAPTAPPGPCMAYGFFSYHHTPDSLRDELAANFEVSRCDSTHDPRYVVAEARKRPGVDYTAPLPVDPALAAPPSISPQRLRAIASGLNAAERLATQLEVLHDQLALCLDAGQTMSACARASAPDLGGILVHLENIAAVG